MTRLTFAAPSSLLAFPDACAGAVVPFVVAAGTGDVGGLADSGLTGALPGGAAPFRRAPGGTYALALLTTAENLVSG
jgi:hypothetical protein